MLCCLGSYGHTLDKVVNEGNCGIVCMPRDVLSFEEFQSVFNENVKEQSVQEKIQIKKCVADQDLQNSLSLSQNTLTLIFIKPVHVPKPRDPIWGIPPTCSHFQYPWFVVFHNYVSERRDRVTRFDESEIVENNGHGTVSLDQLIHEVSFKLGCTKKYGA